MNEVYVITNTLTSWTVFPLMIIIIAYALVGMALFWGALENDGEGVGAIGIYALVGLVGGSLLYGLNTVTKDKFLANAPEDTMVRAVEEQFSLDPETTNLYEYLNESERKAKLAATAEVDDDDTLYIIRNGKRCEYNYVHVPSTTDSEGNVTLTPANDKCVHEHRGS